MNWAIAGRPRIALYVVPKLATSKRILSVLNLSGELKVTGSSIHPSGLAKEPWVISKKGGDGFNELLEICKASNASVKRRLIELPPSMSTRPSRMFCTVGLTTMV